jgi:hypothetical protein
METGGGGLDDGQRICISPSIQDESVGSPKSRPTPSGEAGRDFNEPQQYVTERVHPQTLRLLGCT